jgi:hypothetical protein
MNEDELATRLLEMASMPDHDLEHFREASYRTAALFGPDRFGEGLVGATTMAIKLTPKRLGIIDRALLLTAATFGR